MSTAFPILSGVQIATGHTSDKFQERFTAYATAHGRTPEAQLEHDTEQYPGGKMAGYMCWIREIQGKFAKAHPSKMLHGSITDQTAFTAFVNEAAAAQQSAPKD